MSIPADFIPPADLPRELALPPAVGDKPAAREFIRGFFDGDSVDFAIETRLSEHPQVWGYLLADMVKHTCKTYGQAYPEDERRKVEIILEVLLRELKVIE